MNSDWDRYTWVKWRPVNKPGGPRCETWHLIRTKGLTAGIMTACGCEIGKDPLEYSAPFYPPGGPQSCCGRCIKVLEAKQ